MRLSQLITSVIIVVLCSFIHSSNEYQLAAQELSEETIYNSALDGLPKLRVLDISEYERGRGKGLLDGGVDKDRSVPRVGYFVYHEFGRIYHFYDSKAVRTELYLLPKKTIQVLTKKLGKPSPGPKYEWMKAKNGKVDEQMHWNFTIDTTKLKCACEITTFVGSDTVAVSIIDVERAEAAGKAVSGR